MRKFIAILSILLLSTFCSFSNGQAENYTIRIGFEEFATNNDLQIVEQYATHGVHFQNLGDGNGSISFATINMPPFGVTNWQDFPKIGLVEVYIPFTNFPNINKRHINFDQQVSYISFWYTNGQQSPIFAWPVVAVWDGLNGTGNVLNNNPNQPFKRFPGEQLPWNAGRKDFWQFNAGSNIIKSISIITTQNRIGIDDIVVKYATTPLGGYINVTSDLDGSTPLEVYLDGDPVFLGSPQGASPVSLISVDTGIHSVTLYKPGYEWNQQYVNIVEGQTTNINAVMSPIIEPIINAQVAIQANGSDINGEGRAAPYLADWNDDGLVDLIKGTETGDIKVYINTNTNTEPEYGEPITALTATGVNASPIAIDFYVDGKIDLVVGYADGSVKVFYNQGTDTSPVFGSSAYDSILVTAPSGDAVPFIVDWNNDGKKDLLVGCADGKVYLYLNQRLDASPDYTGVTPSVVVALNSTNAAPAAVLDWDGDGRKDLLVGAGDGTLHLFINTGTDEAPVLGAGTVLTWQDSTVIDLGLNAKPIAADYNNDHIKDIIAGNSEGKVMFLEGVVPSANGDINRDGRVDMLDLSILQAQWCDAVGDPSADIAPVGGDNMVNLLDFAVLAQNWLYGTI